MGQRRKTGDGTRLPAISRRAVIGVTAALPLAGPARSVAHEVAADVSAQCADWLALDLEIDRIARRWAELEVLAARDFDYFRLTAAQISALPMGPEMDALTADLDRLHEVRRGALKPLGMLTPRTTQDALAQLAIAYRILCFEQGDAWPFVDKAWSFLSRSCCPGCGAAYAPADLLPVNAQ